MANNIIKVIFNENISVNLNSDTPDLDKLVYVIVNNRDNINISNIKVESDSPGFDTNGFKEVITASINEFIKNIKIDEDEFNNAMKKLVSEEDEI